MLTAIEAAAIKPRTFSNSDSPEYIGECLRALREAGRDNPRLRFELALTAIEAIAGALRSARIAVNAEVRQSRADRLAAVTGQVLLQVNALLDDKDRGETFADEILQAVEWGRFRGMLNDLLNLIATRAQFFELIKFVRYLLKCGSPGMTVRRRKDLIAYLAREVGNHLRDTSYPTTRIAALLEAIAASGVANKDTASIATTTVMSFRLHRRIGAVGAAAQVLAIQREKLPAIREILRDAKTQLLRAEVTPSDESCASEVATAIGHVDAAIREVRSRIFARQREP